VTNGDYAINKDKIYRDLWCALNVCDYAPLRWFVVHLGGSYRGYSISLNSLQTKFPSYQVFGGRRDGMFTSNHEPETNMSNTQNDTPATSQPLEQSTSLLATYPPQATLSAQPPPDQHVSPPTTPADHRTFLQEKFKELWKINKNKARTPILSQDTMFMSDVFDS
jgi:hypothetical protein